MLSGVISNLLDGFLTGHLANHVTEVRWLTPAEFSAWVTTTMGLDQRIASVATGLYTRRLLVALASMQLVCGVPLSIITGRLAADRRQLLAHALSVNPYSESWEFVKSSLPPTQDSEKSNSSQEELREAQSRLCHSQGI